MSLHVKPSSLKFVITSAKINSNFSGEKSLGYKEKIVLRRVLVKVKIPKSPKKNLHLHP